MDITAVLTSMIEWLTPSNIWTHGKKTNEPLYEIFQQCGVCDQQNLRAFASHYINEPVHKISNNVVCATSKASDQPAHTRSLIIAFASGLSIIWLLSYWLNTIWSF